MPLHPEAQKLADYIRSQFKPISSIDRIALVERMTLEKLNDAIAQYAEQNPHDETEDILPGWCADDIYTVVKISTDWKFTVSKEDAVKVLKRASKYMDANQGINWDILWIHAGYLRDEGAILFIPNEEDPDDY